MIPINLFSVGTFNCFYHIPGFSSIFISFTAHHGYMWWIITFMCLEYVLLPWLLICSRLLLSHCHSTQPMALCIWWLGNTWSTIWYILLLYILGRGLLITIQDVSWNYAKVKQKKNCCWILFSGLFFVTMVDFLLYFWTREGERGIQWYVEWISKGHPLVLLRFIAIRDFREHDPVSDLLVAL